LLLVRLGFCFSCLSSWHLANHFSYIVITYIPLNSLCFSFKLLKDDVHITDIIIPARQGGAGHGMARPGMAWQGKAELGVARHGTAFSKARYNEK
jgi:hypothetical protein